MPDTTTYLTDPATQTAAELSRQLAETRAECARLREALTDAVNTVGTSRKGYFGDSVGYCPQVAEWQVERWRGVLYDPHSVTPQITEQDALEQARAEGYAAGVEAERERIAQQVESSRNDSRFPKMPVEVIAALAWAIRTGDE